jgi:hypothetical protein
MNLVDLADKLNDLAKKKQYIEAAIQLDFTNFINSLQNSENE